MDSQVLPQVQPIPTDIGIGLWSHALQAGMDEVALLAMPRLIGQVDQRVRLAAAWACFGPAADRRMLAAYQHTRERLMGGRSEPAVTIAPPRWRA